MSKRKRTPTPLEQTAQLLNCQPNEVPERVQMLYDVLRQPWAVVTIAFHPQIEGQPMVAIQGVPEGKVGLRMIQKRLLAVAQDITSALDRIEEQERVMQEEAGKAQDAAPAQTKEE